MEIGNYAIAWWNKVNSEERDRLTKKYIFRVVSYEKGLFFDPLRVDEIEKIYQAEVLLQSIKNDLKNGYDPSNPNLFLDQIISENISLHIIISNE
jgi:hypothetical protein